jgi:hypothetical protein
MFQPAGADTPGFPCGRPEFFGNEDDRCVCSLLRHLPAVSGGRVGWESDNCLLLRLEPNGLAAIRLRKGCLGKDRNRKQKKNHKDHSPASQKIPAHPLRNADDEVLMTDLLEHFRIQPLFLPRQYFYDRQHSESRELSSANVFAGRSVGQERLSPDNRR